MWGQDYFYPGVTFTSTEFHLQAISQIQQIILQSTLELLQNAWVISTSPGNQLIFILFICTSACSIITSNFRLIFCQITAKKNGTGNLPSFYSKQTQIIIFSAVVLSTWLSDGPVNGLVDFLFLAPGPAVSPPAPRALIAIAQGQLRYGAAAWPWTRLLGAEPGEALLGTSAPSRAFKLKPSPLVPAQAMLQVALCPPFPLTNPDPDPMI